MVFQRQIIYTPLDTYSHGSSHQPLRNVLFSGVLFHWQLYYIFISTNIHVPRIILNKENNERENKILTSTIGQGINEKREQEKYKPQQNT